MKAYVTIQLSLYQIFLVQYPPDVLEWRLRTSIANSWRPASTRLEVSSFEGLYGNTGLSSQTISCWFNIALLGIPQVAEFT